MNKKEIVKYLRYNYPRLIRFQRNIRLKKLLKVLIAEAVLVAVYFLCKVAFDDLGFGDALIVSIAVLALIVPIFIKPRFIFIAPIKYGSIVKLNVVIAGGAKDVTLMMNDVEARQTHTVLNIVVRSQNGSNFELTLPHHFEQAMRVGDEIVKLPAVDIPIIISEGHGKRLCPICGNIAPSSETECIGCGNKFIKFE